jgi:hypothetical protein
LFFTAWDFLSYFIIFYTTNFGELWDEEPVVTLCRVLEAVLLVVGQPDLAPWCLTEAALLASSSSALTAPPISASTHENPRYSSRTTDSVWQNTLFARFL